MPSPSSSSPLLVEQLQQLTEALAATHTQVQVLDATLAPAIQALGAVSGAILLLDPDTHCLTIAAMQGHAGQTLWQDGPLTPQTPAGDALMNRQTLYFEHAGALTSAYPRLEEQTGGIAAVATAILPLLLEGQGLGVLILDFREPHTFIPEEQRFLPSLAGQCSIALGRAQLIDALQVSDTRFRRLIDASPVGVAVGSLEGRLTQVNDTYLRLLGYSRAQFEGGDIDWQSLTPPEYQAQDQAAFEIAFKKGASAPYEKEMLTRTGERLPLGITLLRYDDRQVVGYVQDLRAYKAEQQVLRDEQDRLSGLVTERTAELQAGQADMQTFVAFTEAASQITDLDLLARLALNTLRRLIPGANVVLTELTPTHWALRSWTDNLDPALLEMAQTQGFPLETPVFAELLATGQPSFTDGWNETEQEVDHTAQFQAVAHYPIVQSGRVVAAIGLAVTYQTVWTEDQKAVVRAVGRSFTLLYDRIATARQLRAQQEETEQRARALEAFVRFTTAVASSTDLKVLARAAADVVDGTVDGARSGFYLIRDDTAYPVFLSENTPPEVAAARWAGISLQIPLLQVALQHSGTFFADAALSQQHAAGPSPLSVRVYRQDGQPYAFLATSLARPTWGEQQQAIVESIGDGLALALGRSQIAQQMLVQKHEAERRTQALEAFAELSREFPGETDRYALIRRAQEIMLSLLTPGYALYWEAGEDRWHLKSQVGDIGDPALQAFVDEYGLPLDTPALHSTWLTGVPNYQDNYAQGADTPAEMIRHVQAATAFQVRLYGQPLGMLAIGLFDQRQWTSVDRAALETAIYSLSLVLERAQGLEALAGRTAQLAQANTELTYANQELEAFTYSASHDMRTPVRHITGFTGLALKALQSTPNPKAERHLGVVTEAAVRINNMIDAMLALSRAGRMELRPRLIPLASLIQQACTDAMLEFPERRVNWEIGRLPTVRGDATLLQQVLTNLLSNAVKFTAPDQEIQVWVWAEEQPGAWMICVRDNGVGFDPQYGDKLFGAFQRLHRQEEFAGTGIGLATVRRIITRHGGRVWAQSAVGQGATFAFTLPR